MEAAAVGWRGKPEAAPVRPQPARAPTSYGFLTPKPDKARTEP